MLEAKVTLCRSNCTAVIWMEIQLSTFNQLHGPSHVSEAPWGRADRLRLLVCDGESPTDTLLRVYGDHVIKYCNQWSLACLRDVLVSATAHRGTKGLAHALGKVEIPSLG